MKRFDDKRMMALRVTLFAFLILLPCVIIAPVCAQENLGSHAAEIRALVKESVGLDGAGVAVLVARNGGPLHLAGYGFSNLKTRERITPDSLFDLASVSKQFTATAILTLAEAGKLDVSKPVVDYLKDFDVPVEGRAVTIDDLLHHVSGLADYTGDEWDGSSEEFAELTPESHLQWLNQTKPRRAPGVRYEYNNSEYALLALIVERVSGMTFSDYLHDKLFVPAGMNETFVLDGKAKLPKSTVKGYKTGKGGEAERSYQATIMTGDGNVFSSVRDLARWDAAMRQHKVITERSQSIAWRNGKLDNHKPIRTDDGDGYGYGWVVEAKAGRVSHSGAWDGTSTYLLLNNETGLTVAVLSNNEDTEVGELAEAIATLFEED